jgi:hypothetical protein
MSRGIVQGKARGKLRTDFDDGPLRGTWRQPRSAWRKVQPLDVINFLFRHLMQFSLSGGWVKGKKQRIPRRKSSLPVRFCVSRNRIDRSSPFAAAKFIFAKSRKIHFSQDSLKLKSRKTWSSGTFAALDNL